MRYKTTIEIICDATDKEDAFHTAGEYLRSACDSGVDMKCRTVSLNVHRMLRCGALSMAVLLCFSAFLLRTVSSGEVDHAEPRGVRVAQTCTVVPELKTKDTDSFKAEWKEKKQEAILDYLKN